MAQIFRAKRAAKPTQEIEMSVESLDHRGKGVAKHQGKVCFVDGALPEERVSVKVKTAKAKLLEGTVSKVIEPSKNRVAPFCSHYKQCGGCQLQHLQLDAQLEYKQQAVTQLFRKFSGVTSLPWQPFIVSESENYRRAGRIACFYDKQKKRFNVGFRAHQSKKIIQIEHCPVVVDVFSRIFNEVEELVAYNPTFNSISHIQFCQADNANFVLLRHTKSIDTASKAQLVAALPQYVIIFDDGHSDIQYDTLPYYEIKTDLERLKVNFKLDNFIQVNAEVNQKMLEQASDWLSLSKVDKVLDLFSGVGNFTLLFAKQANVSIGVEGVASSVAMAKQNAQTNHITNVQFYHFDLTERIDNAPWYDTDINILVLDPSRTGAQAVLERLPLRQFEKVLYISCDPVTLARDSEVLIEAGFEITKVGLMNMFPHTGHIETMALFQRR